MRVPERLAAVMLFAVLFGGLLGLLIWKAGGVVPDEPDDAGTEIPASDDDPADGAFTPVPGRGMQIGEGHGVRFEQRAVELVGDERIPFTAWRAAARTSRPGSGSTPDVRHLVAGGLTLWIFPQPTTEEPRPRAVEGPGTYRIDAEEADLRHRPANQQDDLTADLSDDVVVTWYLDAPRAGMPGQRTDVATLSGPYLTLGVAKTAGGAARSLTSQDVVDIRAPGLTLTGLGLDGLVADRRKGADARLDILANVRATFLVKDGALRPDGGTVSDQPVTATITCSGPTRLVSLEGGGDLGQGRWRATFDKDVRVEQEGSVLTCDHLLVEFYMRDLARGSEEKTKSVPVEKFEAKGHVVLTGTRADETYIVAADEARSFESDRGESIVELEGNVRTEFGALLPSGETSGPVDSIIRVRSRRARLSSRPREQHQTEQSRVQLKYLEQVVVHHVVRASGKIVTQMTAPTIELYGNRHLADGRFEPEYLVGDGGVVITRDEFEAHAGQATWRTDPQFAIEDIDLTTNPSVTFHGGSPNNPWGTSTSNDFVKDGSFVLTSAESIQVIIHRPVDSATNTERRFANVSATRSAVLRKLVGERETLRLTADKLDAAFDAQKRLDHMAAYGNAQLSGEGEDARARRVEASGDRILVQRVPAPEGDPDAWHGGATIHGGRVPGKIVIHEPNGARHEVTAPLITTSQNGSLIEAQRGVEAVLDLGAASADTSKPVKIVARDMRVQLAQAQDEDGSARQELRRIDAEAGVRLIGQGFYVAGDTMSFDPLTGVAEAHGVPAYVKFSDPDTKSAYESYVRSSILRVFVDSRTGQKPKFLRASCTDGYIVRYLFPETTAVGVALRPERVTVRARGAIDVESSRGRASDDVTVTYEEVLGPNSFKKDAEVHCDDLELTFDPDAPGDPRHRVTHLVASGRGNQQVRLTGRGLDATAHRVEGSGRTQGLRLFAGGGRKVWVQRKDPASGFTALAQEFAWNFHTEDFEIFGAEYLED